MSPPDASTVFLHPVPGRRRDKRQLSCHSCRQRKRKCDRQTPCSYCVKHHMEATCSYAGYPAPSPSTPYRQQYTIPPNARGLMEGSGTPISQHAGLATPSSDASGLSHDGANLSLSKTGTGFKDLTHWTSVLSGVTEAREQDDPIQSETVFDDGSRALEHSVLLFEGCGYATQQELLASLPSRREADSLIALYFRAQEYRSAIHPAEFLKRYNAFWDNPGAAPVSWLGLLYSVFCLISQVQSQDRGQQHNGNPALEKTLRYRERVVQCLTQSQFTKGGPDIMETLIHYLLIESYLTRDSSTGVWLLMGNIVQIAIRMGYHRDPQHFKSLSPYQGEMRRRMWAIIYSLDLGFSTQMGLPGGIKHALSDSMPPRNLQDRDFDANSTDLPLDRARDELTSSTVIIAKLHVASNIGPVWDLVCDPHPLSYENLVAANSTLDRTYATMPNPCRFRPLAESLLDPPSIIFQRIHFYMHYQRARILVNWKFLSTSKNTIGGDESWRVVIEATLEILRLHQRTAEESDVLDAFRPTALVDSCFINNGYFLGASVACFLVQHRTDRLSAEDLFEVRSLLERSLGIWSRTTDLSREASKVASALRAVLGKAENPGTQFAMDQGASPQTGGDPSYRSQMAYSTASLLDDLPWLMMDIENEAFPALPAIPVLESWLQLDRIV